MPEIEINHLINSSTISLFLRNLRYYEGLEEYDNVEINIFDNFGDNEARYEINDMQANTKNDIIDRTKKFLKQFKKNLIARFFHELFRSILWRNL